MSKASNQQDAALDWLMEWALSIDPSANAHYWHIADGIAASCGCTHEGEPRT